MNYSQPRGISLMEVMVATGMLAVTATAVVMATTSSMRNTRLSDETRAVSFAARKKLEEYLNPNIGFTTARDQARTEGTFKVFINDVQGTDSDGVVHRQIELPGLNGNDAGELIAVDDEVTTAAMLGRDLTGGPGPDGVTLAPLPIDFNGNNTTNDANDATFEKTRCKVLLGVVVRWTSTNGLEQRYELWCVR